MIDIAGVVTESTIAITITDQGHGIPAEKIGQIFEPFFTTKDPGKGTGLGLAIASSIVQEHQGSITAIPSPIGQRNLHYYHSALLCSAGKYVRLMCVMEPANYVSAFIKKVDFSQ